jgi:hypothetical protein
LFDLVPFSSLARVFAAAACFSLAQDLVALLRVLLAMPKFFQFLGSGRESAPHAVVRFCWPPSSFSHPVLIFFIDLSKFQLSGVV